MKKDNKEKKALVFAPMPPPVGGVASITAMLYNGMTTESVVFDHPVSKNDSKKTNLGRGLENLKKLITATKKIVQGGRVLFFSSANASFFEKLIWSRIVIVLGRRPTFIMVDGNFPRFYSALPKLRRKVIHFLLANKNIVIGTQSEAWGTYYREIFPKVKIKTVSASVDEIFFLQQEKKLEKVDSINVLYVGWIIEDKGIIDLLDAIEQIKSCSGVKYRLVGTLFEKEDFWKQETIRRKIDDIVVFTGALTSRDALLSEYRNADIFVFPSHYEGFPVALLEALVMGLPCIGTDVGGIPDILDNGKAGIVVTAHNPDGLSKALLKLINDPVSRENFSSAAASRGETNYNFAKLIDSYKEILEING